MTSLPRRKARAKDTQHHKIPKSWGAEQKNPQNSPSSRALELRGYKAPDHTHHSDFTEKALFSEVQGSLALFDL